MTCDSVPLNIAALPPILVGPLVRRVTRTEVAIWAILKEGGDVSLHIQQAGVPVADVWTKPPLRIGRHLYVVNIYVNLSVTPGANIGGEFAPNTVYEYWLTRNDPADPPLNFNWAMLAYGGLAHPSFAGLPAQATDFNLAHDSCRKFHGGGRDGLAILDVILNETGSDPALRPHCLVLTGDQIYADEISSVVMPRLLRIHEDLVGMSDHLLDPFVQVDGKTIRVRHLKKQQWKFGSSNHLWRLGDFYAAYMLYWSDVLWPADLPTYAECLPLISTENPEDEANYNKERFHILNFKAEVPRVRKVLANIPTFMTFDDHEFTDDWNLNYEWVLNVYKNDPEARRVAMNAMAAFALFQHWGNAPATFETPGRAEERVLNALQWVDGGGGVGQHPLDANPPLFTPVDVGFPDPNRPDWIEPVDPGNVDDVFVMRPNFTSEGIRYDFTVGPGSEFPIRLVGIDNRTPRDFHPLTAFGGRVDSNALNAMLPAAAIPQSVPTVISLPVPLTAVYGRDHVAIPLTMYLEKSEAAVDLESNWHRFAHKYAELMQRIATYSPAVVLTGDIHFSAAHRIVYEELDLSQSPTFTGYIAQFIVSAAKNADARTVGLNLAGEAAQQLHAAHKASFVFYPELALAQRLALISLPGDTVALEWIDYFELASGRVFRAALEAPAIIPEDIADGFDLDGIAEGLDPAEIAHHKRNARYTVDYVDQQPANLQLTSGPYPALQDIVLGPDPLVNGWDGWDPDKSARLVNAFRDANLLRIASVVQGMGVVALIHFSQQAGVYTAIQRLKTAVGVSAAGGNPEAIGLNAVTDFIPGVNLFEVRTEAKLGP